MTAVCSFETSAINYSTTQRNNPEDLVPQYESGLATTQLFVYLVRSAVSVPHN